MTLLKSIYKDSSSNSNNNNKGNFAQHKKQQLIEANRANDKIKQASMKSKSKLFQLGAQQHQAQQHQAQQHQAQQHQAQQHQTQQHQAQQQPIKEARSSLVDTPETPQQQTSGTIMQSQLPRRCAWRPSSAKISATRSKCSRSNLPQPVSGLVALSRITTTNIGTKTVQLPTGTQKQRSLASCSVPPNSRLALANHNINSKPIGTTSSSLANNNNKIDNSVRGQLSSTISSISSPKEANCLSLHHQQQLYNKPTTIATTHFVSSLAMTNQTTNNTNDAANNGAHDKQIKQHQQNSNQQLIELAASIASHGNQMYLNHNNTSEATLTDLDTNSRQQQQQQRLNINLASLHSSQLSSNHNNGSSSQLNYCDSNMSANSTQIQCNSQNNNNNNNNLFIGQDSKYDPLQYVASKNCSEYSSNSCRPSDYSAMQNHQQQSHYQHITLQQQQLHLNQITASHYVSGQQQIKSHHNDSLQQAQMIHWDYGKNRLNNSQLMNNQQKQHHQQHQQQQHRGPSPTYCKAGYMLAAAPSNTVVGGGGYDLAAAVMGSPPKSTSSQYDSTRHYKGNNPQQPAPFQSSGSGSSSESHTSSPSSLSSHQSVTTASATAPITITTSNNNNSNNLTPNQPSTNFLYRRARSPSLSAASSYSVQQSCFQQFPYNSGNRFDDTLSTQQSSSNYQGISLAAAIRRSNSLKAGSCLDMTQTGRMVPTSAALTNNLLIRHHHLTSQHNSAASRSGNSSRASSPPAATVNGQQQTTNSVYSDTNNINSSFSPSGPSEFSSLNRHYSSNLLASVAQQTNNFSSNNNSSIDQQQQTRCTVSSAAYISEVKLQHELRKLQRELDMERDKNMALSNQLNINSGLMAAFEQSLSTLNNRLHQLTTLTEKKDNEIDTLKQKVQMYKSQHKRLYSTSRDHDEDELDDGLSATLDKHLDSDKTQDMDEINFANLETKKDQPQNNNSSELASHSSDISTSSSSSESRQEDILICDTSVQSSNSLNADDLTGGHSSMGSSINNGQSTMNKTINTCSKNGTTNDGMKEIKTNGSDELTTTLIDKTYGQNFEKQYCLAKKKIEDLERQLREKDRLLTDSRLEALSAAHQLEQLETSMGEFNFDIIKHERSASGSLKLNSKTPDLIHEYSNLDDIGLSPRHLASMSPNLK